MEFTTQLTMKNLTSSADFGFLPLDFYFFFQNCLNSSILAMEQSTKLKTIVKNRKMKIT